LDDGRFQLRVRTVQRATLPADGDVASWLTVQLARAVEDGRLGPVAGVVVRESVVDLVDLAPVRADGRVPWLLAGMTSTRTDGGGVEAVGLWGRMERHRRGGPSETMAAVFLEWSDCRWWFWSARVDDEGLVESSIAERSALDGDPMPDGLGRWWTRARRERMSVRLQPQQPVVH
jgi:hypothetical protein